MIQRWITLRTATPTNETIPEQFFLAQRLTAELDPPLYAEIQELRTQIVKYLRRPGRRPMQKPDGFRGDKYTVMAPQKVRYPVWSEIELTPDISFTSSTELTGQLIPASMSRRLKSLIQQQVRILNSL
jgi:hypothetical protein